MPGMSFMWEHDAAHCHLSIARKQKVMNSIAQPSLSLSFIGVVPFFSTKDDTYRVDVLSCNSDGFL